MRIFLLQVAYRALGLLDKGIQFVQDQFTKLRLYVLSKLIPKAETK